MEVISAEGYAKAQAEERAKKDIVDIKYRLLRDLPDDQVKESGQIVEKTGGNPKKLLAAAKAEVKRKRLVLGRRLAFEAKLDMKAPEKLKREIGAFTQEVGNLLTSGRRVHLLKTGLLYDPGELVGRLLNANFEVVEVVRMESEDYHHNSIRSGRYEQVIYELKLREG